MEPEEFFIEEFTEPVILPNGTATTGIFDNLGSTALGINTTSPQVSLLQADADLCRDGDPLHVAGKEYRVKDKEYSDDGIVIVQLETV